MLIGVPGTNNPGPDDNGRAKARKEKIIQIVEGHMDRMAEKTLVEDISIEYAYLSTDDPAFMHYFPKHTKFGKGPDLDEPLALPAVRMMNARSGDFMLPDWEILLMDFPDELDRLVSDFERWMTQTDDVGAQEDGVLLLHSRNIDAAVAENPIIFTAFYAPWCRFSQAMLPKVSGASALLAELVEKNHIPAAAMAIGKVNVDEEGSLRKAYNVTTYPTLLMLGDGGGDGSNGSNRKRDGSGIPHTVFPGDIDSATDIVAHLATVAAGSMRLASSTDVDTLAGLMLAVDAFFERESEGTAEDGTKKQTALALLILPASKSSGMADSAYDAVIKAVRTFTGGKEVFVAATEDPALGEAALSKLEFAAPEVSIDGGDAEQSIVAMASRQAAASATPVLLVATRRNGVLSVPLPSIATMSSSSSTSANSGGIEFSLGTRIDILKALWPTYSRFSSRAAQGERIRSGVMSDIALLVADEDGDPFMFEGFLDAFKEAAAKLRGRAFFLYADDDEPRIMPLLRRANAPAGEPVVVIMSMVAGGDPPKVLLADRISVQGITAAFDVGSNNAATAEGKDEL